MATSRTKNSFRNAQVAIAGQLLGLLISFISRKVFVFFLSAEYLGVSALFTNILTLLSLAELGIGSAITYSLYTPIAKQDINKINALMSIYKRAYTTIGWVVLGIGLSITPFVKWLINDDHSIDNIHIIYILFVLNTGISYFFTYKRSYIIANQKKYIVTIYRYVCFFVMNLSQILVLWLTGNFILFLLLQIFFTFLDNFLVSKQANRMYPFLKNKVKTKLAADEKTSLFRNIRAMVYHKIGGVVVGGTDSILLSKMVSLIEVAKYSNYLLILQALNTMTSLLYQSITASVGNLIATKSEKYVLKVFYTVNFIGFWIFGFCSVTLFNLANPFISIWVGNDYLFDLPIVFILCLNFYLTGMRQSVLTFRSAFGLYWHDRYKAIYEAIINLIASIILANYFGTLGIFIGTAISTVTMCITVEPYILYKYAFKVSFKSYYIRYLVYTFALVIAGFFTTVICNQILLTGILEIAAKLFVCIFVLNTLLILFFFKTQEFYEVQLLVKKIFKFKTKVKVDH